MLKEQPKKTLWRKIIGFFTADKKTACDTRLSEQPENYQKKYEDSTLESWIPGLDNLTAIVKKLRQELDLDKVYNLDLEFLGLITYLYHIDRLLVKVRENMLTFRYRQGQILNEFENITKSDYAKVNQCCLECYHIILQLTILLQKSIPKKSYSKLYNDDLILEVHALELASSTLESMIRALNQAAYKQESAFQLSELEKTLMQSLERPSASYPKSYQGATMFNDYTLSPQGVMYSTSEYLRTKLRVIPEAVDQKFMQSIIDSYDNLKKCYVVSRKAVIKGTLDIMAENMEMLSAELAKKEQNKDVIFEYLNQIFNSLESLRFSTNRESRCSRNLFEKAKSTRKLLRKACGAHPIAKEFLKEIYVARETLVRPKIVSK